ncbi:unnamed protein product [Lactuca saligna]|uniref:30S ribosomal protein S17, chloroplastic n=1 Tax=Lactuca saligna TaxID=75948 RepID=A0AA35Z2R0_LACSI|nr:unnamed protein product [Lactuca saligna]
MGVHPPPSSTSDLHPSRNLVVGMVVSNKMKKSVVVAVDRHFQNKHYNRYVKRTSKFMAHDEQNQCNIGDRLLLNLWSGARRYLQGHKRKQPSTASREEAPGRTIRRSSLMKFEVLSSPRHCAPASEYSYLETTYGLTSLDSVEFPSPGSSILSPLPGKVGIYQKTLDAGLRLPLTDFLEDVFQRDGCSVQMLTPNAVNKGLVGSGRYRANTFADTTPKLFPHNQGVADFLKNVQVSPEDYSEALLAGVGMSLSWRLRGKMAVFFLVVGGTYQCFPFVYQC